MPDPLKLSVLKALTTHLEGIQGDEWGGFNLEGCVFRGRNRFGDDVPETFISIMEAPRPDQGRDVGWLGEERAYGWELLLQAWTIDDTLNPTDPLYLLEYQITRRLHMIIDTNEMSGFPTYPEVYLLGNRITEFRCGPGVIRPPTDNLSSKSCLYLPLRLGL